MSNEPTCPKCGEHRFLQQVSVTTTTRTLFVWSEYDQWIDIKEHGKVDNEKLVTTLKCNICGHPIPSNYLEAWTIVDDQSGTPGVICL